MALTKQTTTEKAAFQLEMQKLELITTMYLGFSLSEIKAVIKELQQRAKIRRCISNERLEVTETK